MTVEPELGYAFGMANFTMGTMLNIWDNDNKVTLDNDFYVKFVIILKDEYQNFLNIDKVLTRFCLDKINQLLMQMI